MRLATLTAACSPSAGITSKTSRTYWTQLAITLSWLVVSPAS
jgi:hypothetical protein